jgi:fumarylpyruvate hydrolase
MGFVIPPCPQPSVEVAGSDQRFAVHRIYCVGRNYAKHAREMGMDPDREAPFFFAKPADAVVANGTPVPYPPRTANLHHEIELVVALAGPREIFGYAAGIDLTRRDVQARMKKEGKPWDTSKGFEHSAPVSAIARAADIGHPSRGRIWLEVNGEPRQDGDIPDMIWAAPAILDELSGWFEVQAGDLVFTGTPAGVGALRPGDRVRGGVDGVGTIDVTVAAR